MNVLVNDKGEPLEILQEPREPQENQFVVPLEGYYEVFNIQGFKYAKWDFEIEMWVGFHKPIYENGKWLETITQEELDAIEAEKNKPQPPSQAERIGELENTILSLMDFMMGGF